MTPLQRKELDAEMKRLEMEWHPLNRRRRLDILDLASLVFAVLAGVMIVVLVALHFCRGIR
jgi:hypothetical protein